MLLSSAALRIFVIVHAGECFTSYTLEHQISKGTTFVTAVAEIYVGILGLGWPYLTEDVFTAWDVVAVLPDGTD